jgi:hypothetical protein
MDGSTVTTYRTYNTNEPRLLPFGLLMEPSRTNYMLNSEAPTAGTKTITLAVGYYTIWSLGNTSTINFAATGTGICTPATNNVSAGTPLQFQVTTAGTFNVIVPANTLRIQIENGPDATSYILSGATPITRADDKLLQNFFGGQLNVDQGTYWVEFMWAGSANYANTNTFPTVEAHLMVAGVGSYTSDARTHMMMVANSGGVNQLSGYATNNSGIPVNVVTLPVPKTPGNVSRAAMSVSQTRAQTAIDYVVGAGAAVTYPGPSLLAVTLGGGGARTMGFNGYIRGFKYWPVAMPDSELKECTGAGYYRGAPIVDLDFTQGVWPNRRATFTRTATTAVVTDGFYTDAAGSSYNTFAGLTTPRFLGSRGLLAEIQRFNYFPVSAAPITRQTISIGVTTTICAWMIGTGSITISNGTGTIGTVQGSLTLTAGQVTKFNMSVAGTLNVTVTGSVNRVQLEVLGNNANCFGLGPSTFIGVPSTSAAARGSEYLIMPTGNWHNAEQYTYYVELMSEDIGWHGYMFPIGVASAANAREQIFMHMLDTTTPVLNDSASQLSTPSGTDGYSSTNPVMPVTPNMFHRMAAAVRIADGVIQGRMASDGALGTPGTGTYGAFPPYPTNFYLNFNPAGGTGNFFFKRARYWDYKLTDDELVALTDIIQSPALDLNLTSTIPASMTFTRNAVGTYFDVNGVIQSAAINTPRFGYDPVTHAARGLLMEDARTNLCLQSGDFTNASWLKTNATLAAGTAGPNGATTGSGVIPANGSIGILYQAIALTAGTTYTLSCFFKAATQTTILLLIAGPAWNDAAARSVTFDLSNGIVSATSGGGVSGTVIAVGNGWYRCTMTCTPDKSASPQVQAARSNSAGNGTSVFCYAFGAQIEASYFPTSYIPTTTATVQRFADFSTMPIAPWWFNSPQGTLVVDGVMSTALVPTGAGNFDVCGFDDGTSSNIYVLRAALQTSALQPIAVSAGVPLAAINGSPGFVAGVPFKAAITYNVSAGTMQCCLNGGVVAVATGMVAPLSITRMNLGWIRQAAMNGWKSRIRYYQFEMTAAQLQRVTT